MSKSRGIIKEHQAQCSCYLRLLWLRCFAKNKWDSKRTLPREGKRSYGGSTPLHLQIFFNC